MALSGMDLRDRSPSCWANRHMPELTLRGWEREFRRDAKADQLAIFRDHLRRLDLPCTPESMLEGTILVVQACSAYAKLDGQQCAPFLEMQKYDPAQSGTARYTFTFDIHGKAFARVLVPPKLHLDEVGQPDLADLYNHPWSDHKVCGFCDLWITCTDWAAPTSEELDQLEQRVTDDLRFDFTEDEVDFWFDDSCTVGALSIHVQDHEGAELPTLPALFRIRKALGACASMVRPKSHSLRGPLSDSARP
jgi:hypothetical protein